MNEDVIAKLKKILARADTSRGATEAEVQTAMRLAQEIAIKNNIDIADIRMDQSTPGGGISINKDEVEFETYEKTYHWPVVGVIQDCFDVRAIRFTGMKNGNAYIARIVLVGEKTDVILARYALSYLLDLFPKCYSTWRKVSLRTDTWVLQKSYYRGLAVGIKEANRRQREALKKEDASKFALVLVEKNALIETKMHEMFPKLRTVKSRPVRHDNHAAHAGYTKGRTVQLSAPLAQNNANNKALK
jgi:hypothetical protein